MEPEDLYPQDDHDDSSQSSSQAGDERGAKRSPDRPMDVWVRSTSIVRVPATQQHGARARVRLTGRSVSYHGLWGLFRRVGVYAEAQWVDDSAQLSDRELIAAAKRQSRQRWH